MLDVTENRSERLHCSFCRVAVAGDGLTLNKSVHRGGNKDHKIWVIESVCTQLGVHCLLVVGNHPLGQGEKLRSATRLSNHFELEGERLFRVLGDVAEMGADFCQIVGIGTRRGGAGQAVSSGIVHGRFDQSVSRSEMESDQAVRQLRFCCYCTKSHPSETLSRDDSDCCANQGLLRVRRLVVIGPPALPHLLMIAPSVE